MLDNKISEIAVNDFCEIKENESSDFRHEAMKLFRDIPIGVLLTNAEQRIEYCNPAFTSIMGFRNEEIIGFNMQDIFFNSHPDVKTKKAIVQVNENSSVSFTSIWNTRSNTEKKIKCKKMDIGFHDNSFEGIAWYIEDNELISRNKNIQPSPIKRKGTKSCERKLEIESSIAFISSTLVAPENIDDAIIASLEKTCRICGASSAYVFRFDKNNETITKTHEWCAIDLEMKKNKFQTFSIHTLPHLKEKLCRGEFIHVKDVSALPSMFEVEKNVLKNNDISSAMVLPLFISGKIAGFIGIHNLQAQDDEWNMDEVIVLRTVANIIGSAIGQKEAEDELNEHNYKLEKAYTELKNIEIMKDEFISNLSHELRTPLNSIYGYGEILYDDGELKSLSPVQRKSIIAIYRNSARLGSLIDSLLYMANVLAGKISYQFDPLQMENVIDNAINQYNYQAQTKKIALKKEINGVLPLINGDVNFLPQLLYKLLDNAIKFTPEGGNVTIRSYEKNSNVHIEVHDTGIGIPEEKIEDIFRSFYQIDGSSTRKYGGAGIGLHISKKIVTAHNGKIWVDNNKNGGAVVHVILPLNNSAC